MCALYLCQHMVQILLVLLWLEWKLSPLELMPRETLTLKSWKRLLKNIRTTYLHLWYNSLLAESYRVKYVVSLYKITTVQLLCLFGFDLNCRWHILQHMVFMKKVLMRFARSSMIMEDKYTWMVPTWMHRFVFLYAYLYVLVLCTRS